jgi:hypothetical protein
LFAAIYKTSKSTMRKLYQLLLILFLSSYSNDSFAQSNYHIDITWDAYYKLHPSGIESNFESSDFVDIVERVNFIPVKREYKGNQQLLKRVLLMFSPDDLKQMQITGNYYSRTTKHDDYFRLYNMVYNPISKDEWNRLCPYLLPLMDIDGTAILR